MKIFTLLSTFSCFLILGCSTSPALHGIGVYEGSYSEGQKHSFGHHPDGHVEVNLHSKNRPVVLVLSSYEPVVWTVVPDKGVKIKEIILSSYHPSKVIGVDSSVKVSRHSFGYSYTSEAVNPDFHGKIIKYTKIPDFESFQGSYKGQLFSIH